MIMPHQVHVTFIHGMSNKPAAAELRRIWLEALAMPIAGDGGFDLGAVGVTASFVYWADLFFDQPIPASEYESRADELAESVPGQPELPDDDWTRKMLEKFPLDQEVAYEEPPSDESTAEYERIPVPWIVKERVMRHFLREAHDYLFNANGLRDTIRARVMDDLNKIPKNARHVLVGHSQGSFIAYDVLTGVPECKQIDGFLTLGSPLGLDEVQDRLVWSRNDGFPAKLRGDWVNVYDPFDIVAGFDPNLTNDFRKNGQEIVINIKEENWGSWRHSATKYLKGPLLRKQLRRLCNREGA